MIPQDPPVTPPPGSQQPDDFDPTQPETFTSAHEQHAQMRATCPVAHTSAYRGYWALFKYQDVVDALRGPDTYVTSVQNVVPKVAFTGRRPPLLVTAANTNDSLVFEALVDDLPRVRPRLAGGAAAPRSATPKGPTNTAAAAPT